MAGIKGVILMRLFKTHFFKKIILIDVWFPITSYMTFICRLSSSYVFAHPTMIYCTHCYPQYLNLILFIQLFSFFDLFFLKKTIILIKPVCINGTIIVKTQGKITQYDIRDRCPKPSIEKRIEKEEFLIIEIIFEVRTDSRK